MERPLKYKFIISFRLEYANLDTEYFFQKKFIHFRS